jgi:hypothetical protein
MARRQSHRRELGLNLTFSREIAWQSARITFPVIFFGR